MDGLYDSDFYAWTQAQAAALRQAAADRVNLPLDWDHLAEEIDSMGKSQRSEIESRLLVLLAHLLKLGYSPDVRPRGGWRATVIEQRYRILSEIERSPSLSAWPSRLLDKAYRAARKMAATDDSVGDLPETCPFDLETEILNEDFMPAPPDAAVAAKGA